MKGRKVIFRADASLLIGSGHVMRCLTLAHELARQGAICHFICRSHDGNLIAYVRSFGYQVHELPKLPESTDEQCVQLSGYSHWLGDTVEQDSLACLPILKQECADWLVLDHYAIDAKWCQGLGDMSCRVLVIDDLANREHGCDLLLDQNLGRKAADYAGKVPDACVPLLGPEYALLRSEFEQLRGCAIRRSVTPAGVKVMISMGGVDLANATGKVLDALKDANCSGISSLDVVMGGQAKWLAQIHQLAGQMPWPTRVSVGVSDMGQRMLEADLAIGAAGGTAWERCCLGVPTVVVVLADNQRAGAEALRESGCAIALDQVDDIAERLPLIMDELLRGDRLERMSEAASHVCDGEGVTRVVRAMQELLDEH